MNLTIFSKVTAPGKSGDFLAQQIPAKRLTVRGLLVGKTTAIFPRSLLSFHFTSHVAYIKQPPGITPHCRGKTLVKAPLISMAIPRPQPGGLVTYD